jgi:hypothetical protein
MRSPSGWANLWSRLTALGVSCRQQLSQPIIVHLFPQEFICFQKYQSYRAHFRENVFSRECIDQQICDSFMSVEAIEFP